MKIKNWVAISVIVGVVGGLMLLFNAEWGKTAAQQNLMTWAGGILVGLFVIVCLVGWFAQGKR